MNPEWGAGKHVALLVEGNTSFGASANPVVQASHSMVAECQPVFTKHPFTSEFVYTFPLHVSQLGDDAQATAGVTGLAAARADRPAQLSRDDAASDQIPALRPQLTSPVAEATIDSILDNIRHERRVGCGHRRHGQPRRAVPRARGQEGRSGRSVVFRRQLSALSASPIHPLHPRCRRRVAVSAGELSAAADGGSTVTRRGRLHDAAAVSEHHRRGSLQRHADPAG